MVTQMEEKYKGIDEAREEYQLMEPDLILVEDLRGGTRVLRDKHQTYLPQFQAEKAKNYERRWKTATLYNAFEETIGVLTGKAFTKPPELDEDDVPVEIREGVDKTPALQEDIDRQGNHFQIFAQDFFKRGLRSGLCHLLVDSTPIPDEAKTQAEKKALGQRPYWVIYNADQVFAWKNETINGKPTLTQVRIKEFVEEEEGDFGVEKIEQIRVLDVGKCRIFRRAGENGPWELHEEFDMKGYDGNLLDYIPMTTFYSDDNNSFMFAAPPLIDLAYQNIKHFQKQSDYDNCMTIACFPVFCISGFNQEEDKFELGPNTAVILKDPQAKAYFAEHSGSALAAARQDLEDKKGEMAMYGLRMLLPKTGQTPTATAEAITEGKTLSQLQVAVMRLKDTLEVALEYTARWLGKGKDAGGSIKVNIENLSLGAQDVDMLLKAAGAPSKPVLDRETVIKEMIRRGWLDENTDPKEVIQALDNQAAQGATMAGLAGAFLKTPEQTPKPALGTPPEKENLPPGGQNQ